MNEALPTSEQELAKWNLVTGSEKDREDLIALHEIRQRQELPKEDFTDIDFPLDCGMILRKGARPVGYVLFNTERWAGKKTLYIEDLYITGEDRNALLIGLLIEELRSFAQAKRVTHVSWISATPAMWRLSHQIGLRGSNIIPIEQFNLKVLMRERVQLPESITKEKET